jgi:nucleoside-triphosphatase THEP1
MSISNLVLRGARGAGKTTLVKRVVDSRRRDLRMAGVITLKETSGLVTIRAWDTFGLFEGGPVEVVLDEGGILRTAGFEGLGVWALRRGLDAAECIVVDELGRFENDCPLFRDAVLRTFASRKPVLAALKAEHTPFLDGLADRRDTVCRIVTPDNREALYPEVLRDLEEAVREGVR